ncbi:MAG: protein phosphatase 2C domain-containing protein [Bacteroidales bacterium]|nr:protein phosphatase 2C domain-containing protein [Bacteroidales bacterium]
MKIIFAAKTDMGLVRTNNEDNFQLASDLTQPRMMWVNNQVVDLGANGALLVVADGMGGMNAGEVASEIAVTTMRQWFAPERLTAEVKRTRFSIEKFMNEAIVQADANIKREAQVHPESKGMGTTIVVAWILEGKLYISWCGDSRAYIYNPAAGLHQITKDHSYVQSLVDKGSITREDAFDFPDSNIITRSLCDGGPKAKPECLFQPYDLCNGDIVLLCTDGLSGMIRDHEMESIIAANHTDMALLVDQLIQAACAAEGSDNITIALALVVDGGGVSNPQMFNATELWLSGTKRQDALASQTPQKGGMTSTVINGGNGPLPGPDNGDGGGKKPGWVTPLICLLCAVIIVLVAWIVYPLIFGDKTGEEEEKDQEQQEMVDTPETTTQPEGDNTFTDTPPAEPAEGSTAKAIRDAAQGSAGIVPSGAAPAANTQEEGTNKVPQGLVKTGKKVGADATDAEKEAQESPEQDKDSQTTVSSEEDKTATDQAKEEPAKDPKKHLVKKGETLYSIAQKYNITVDAIKKANPNIDPDHLQENQVLNLP